VDNPKGPTFSRVGGRIGLPSTHHRRYVTGTDYAQNTQHQLLGLNQPIRVVHVKKEYRKAAPKRQSIISVWQHSPCVRHVQAGRGGRNKEKWHEERLGVDERSVEV